MSEIVAGVEDAASAERILEHALVEAETTGRALQVVSAWTLPYWFTDVTGMATVPMPVAANIAQAASENARDLLSKALVLRSPDAEGVQATSVAKQGTAGQVLVEASKAAGLVVVGGPGYGEFRSVLLGSATLHVLHQAPCPVMVVPSSATPGRYTRIVIALDSGGGAASALRWGLDAARRHCCPAHVVHVQLRNPAPTSAFAGAPYADQSPECHEWLQAQLSEAADATIGVPVTTGVLEGSASAAILAEVGPDDLLVLGSRGHGGFVGLLLGSVAAQCAQHAQGVVVIVKTGELRLVPAQPPRKKPA